MDVSRYVNAPVERKNNHRTGLERIPGTNKIRTYTSNPLQYSHQSDLEMITAEQYRAYGAKKRILKKD